MGTCVRASGATGAGLGVPSEPLVFVLAAGHVDQTVFLEDIGGEMVTEERAVDAARIEAQEIGAAVASLDDQLAGRVVAKYQQWMGRLVVVVPAQIRLAFGRWPGADADRQ